MVAEAAWIIPVPAWVIPAEEWVARLGWAEVHAAWPVIGTAAAVAMAVIGAVVEGTALDMGAASTSVMHMTMAKTTTIIANVTTVITAAFVVIELARNFE